LNAIRSAVLAAALAAPLATLAAPRGAAPARGVAPAPTTETRPRAPAAAPTPAPAPLVAPVEDEPGAEWRVGPSLGFEFGMGDLEYSAPKFRIEAARAYRRTSATTTLSFLASLSIAHASGKEDVPVVIPSFPPIMRQESIEWDANVFELIPGARLTYATTPKVAFFADGGLGLAYTVGRVYLPPAAASLGEGAVLSDGVGGVVRLAGGVVIAPSPALRIAIEAVGLNIRFGDGPGTGFSLGASLTHRL
jgi:hypothetical protein